MHLKLNCYVSETFQKPKPSVFIAGVVKILFLRKVLKKKTSQNDAKMITEIIPKLKIYAKTIFKNMIAQNNQDNTKKLPKTLKVIRKFSPKGDPKSEAFRINSPTSGPSSPKTLQHTKTTPEHRQNIIKT